MTARRLEVRDLGRQSYRDALDTQRSLRLERIAGTLDHDVLLLVEHDPVYTMGRGTAQASLPVPPDQLRSRGADLIEIERGGDVTWHGPGQLVAYPIIHLSDHREDLHWYLRSLEEVIIRALETFGIAGQRITGKTGVWVGERKIASLGIHVKQWVTLHGFALNVHPDLTWFDLVVPCGLHGVTMTSIQHELGGCDGSGLWDATRTAVVSAFATVFDAANVAPLEPLP